MTRRPLAQDKQNHQSSERASGITMVGALPARRSRSRRATSILAKVLSSVTILVAIIIPASLTARLPPEIVQTVIGLTRVSHVLKDDRPSRDVYQRNTLSQILPRQVLGVVLRVGEMPAVRAGAPRPGDAEPDAGTLARRRGLLPHFGQSVCVRGGSLLYQDTATFLSKKSHPKESSSLRSVQ